MSDSLGTCAGMCRVRGLRDGTGDEAKLILTPPQRLDLHPVSPISTFLCIPTTSTLFLGRLLPTHGGHLRLRLDTDPLPLSGKGRNHIFSGVSPGGGSPARSLYVPRFFSVRFVFIKPSMLLSAILARRGTIQMLFVLSSGRLARRAAVQMFFAAK